MTGSGTGAGGTGPGGAGAGGAGAGEAADRLVGEARASAEALLDWLGPRLEDARAGAERARPGAPPPGPRRPPQSAGPCSWCPVCALVAALRGEQPELTARLADQAAGLVVLVRLLLEGHGAHHHPAPAPASEEPAHHRPDDPAAPPGASPEPPRPGERPTGRRSPRPSPRLRAVPLDDGDAEDSAAPAPPPGAATGGPRVVPRRRPAVQRIAVRRVPRDPC